MSTAKIILNRADAKIGTALFLLFTTVLGQANQNTATDFVIHTKMNDRLPRLQTALPRYVQVFGLFIQATERVPDSKLLHAADIAADFLDNDRDGKPDNPAVNDELWKNRAAVVMGYNERELERLHDRYGELFDAYALQGLFATETLPDAGPHDPNSSEFDASIEEILHIITSVGYAEVYPEVFGERKGSALANAMDTARGGYFRSVPRRYPVQAWYTYDDRSCDYGCQITEYVGWPRLQEPWTVYQPRVETQHTGKTPNQRQGGRQNSHQTGVQTSSAIARWQIPNQPETGGSSIEHRSGRSPFCHQNQTPSRVNCQLRNQHQPFNVDVGHATAPWGKPRRPPRFVQRNRMYFFRIRLDE